MGSIVESRLKELHPVMPVMFIKAVTQDKQELRDVIQSCYEIHTRDPSHMMSKVFFSFKNIPLVCHCHSLLYFWRA